MRSKLERNIGGLKKCRVCQEVTSPKWQVVSLLDYSEGIYTMGSLRYIYSLKTYYGLRSSMYTFKVVGAKTAHDVDEALAVGWHSLSSLYLVLLVAVVFFEPETDMLENTITEIKHER